jgi:hypothetical protein
MVGWMLQRDKKKSVSIKSTSTRQIEIWWARWDRVIISWIEWWVWWEDDVPYCTMTVCNKNTTVSDTQITCKRHQITHALRI